MGLLNVNNFYESLIVFLNHTIKNDFIPPLAKKLFFCSLIANELFDLLQAHKLEPNPMTLVLHWTIDDDSSNSRKKCKLDLTLNL